MYLQASQGDAQTWNAQFSSMMVKLLQDSYLNSPAHKANLARSDVLILEAAPRASPPKVGASPCKDLVPLPVSSTQALPFIISSLVLALRAKLAAAKIPPLHHLCRKHISGRLPRGSYPPPPPLPNCDCPVLSLNHNSGAGSPQVFDQDQHHCPPRLQPSFQVLLPVPVSSGLGCPRCPGVWGHLQPPAIHLPGPSGAPQPAVHCLSCPSAADPWSPSHLCTQ